MKMKHVANRRRSVSSRAFIALLALVLVIGCVAGGTVAWLVAKTEPVVNTFTYGNIDITLTETTGTSYKIIPGKDIPKDPKVTVKVGSEACWLFVKVEETNWPDFKKTDETTRKVSYSVNVPNDWKALEGNPGVYYREVPADNAKYGVSYLVTGVVAVSEELTKAEINSIASGTQPQLSFTAYAVQRDGIGDAATAWAAANNS